MMKLRHAIAALALLTTACASGVTGTEEGAGKVDVFARDVLPLLTINCAGPSCHQAGSQAALSSGFGIDTTAAKTYQSMLSAPGLVVPGNFAASRLWEEIDGGEMPPGGALKGSDAQRLLEEWITAGAERFGDPSSEPPEVAGFDNADGLRGGLFYDQFFASGTGYAGQPALTDAEREHVETFSDFFRCKQCHAWDLKGRHGSYANRAAKAHTYSGDVMTKAGRPNVADVDLTEILATATPDELFAFIKGGDATGRRVLADDITDYNPATRARVGDAMPVYGELMTDAEIWNLVRFLKVEALDTTFLYALTVTGAYPTGAVSFSAVGAGGNATAGDALYAANCRCHGAEGTAIAIEGLSIGQFVRSKPNETQHKIKFGQPGTSMGSILTDPADIRDLYAALTDTAKYPNYSAYAGADGLRGGALYDTFYAYSTGIPFSSTISDADFTKITTYGNFFRCKQCHGWDRLGNAGAYIGRAARTSRPNVSGVDLAAFAGASTTQEIHDALARTADRRNLDADLAAYNPTTNNVEGDKMPDLTEILSETDLWALTRFLKKEALDTTVLYTIETTGSYPTGSAVYSDLGGDGDAAHGRELFAEKCARCHGPDGTAIPIDETLSVGAFVRASPYEAQHKIKFGQPDSYPPMEGGLVSDPEDVKDLLKALSDRTSFPVLPPH